MSSRLFSLLFACSIAACGQGDPMGDAGDAGLASTGDATVDGPVLSSDGATSASDLGPTTDGATPVGLPFPYPRPSAGTPVPDAELTALTDKYLALLQATRYFAVLDERVTGWPQSDPMNGYWWGTWWSGCGLDKAAGLVTFKHLEYGADNTGIPTSEVLEGACAAQRLWPSAARELLVRRLVRGFNAYVLGMQRMPSDPAGVLLARTVYPPSIASTDGGRAAYLDYSLDRPGLDSYTQYVHIPGNPILGDVYIKNNRSKDDVGHMLRAIDTLADCAPSLGADALADVAAMRAGYQAWAQRVEADGWAIATYNHDADLVMPPFNSTMSRYNLLLNAECDAALALHLFGAGNVGALACGNGIHPLEALALGTVHNGEIIRSYHEAAARSAITTLETTTAKALLDGLVARMDDGMAQAEAGTLPAHLTPENLVKLLVEGAATGVPLTWREVRYLHQQIDLAYTSYVTNGTPGVYDVWNPATPDGSYDFTPAGSGVSFTYLATLASTCTARYRNPTSAPLFDCAHLAAGAP